jgi:hypothetical protein
MEPARSGSRLRAASDIGATQPRFKLLDRLSDANLKIATVTLLQPTADFEAGARFDILA